MCLLLIEVFVLIDHYSFEVKSDEEDSEAESEPDLSKVDSPGAVASDVDSPGAVASDVDSPGAVASEVPVVQITDTTGPIHDRYVNDPPIHDEVIMCYMYS